jgi:ABC-type proline/glycine betaine transport system ATPase subunit
VLAFAKSCFAAVSTMFRTINRLIALSYQKEIQKMGEKLVFIKPKQIKNLRNAAVRVFWKFRKSK